MKITRMTKFAFYPIVSLTAAASLMACGGGGGNSGPVEPAIATVYHGTWQASGYGEVFEIGSDSVKLYKHTSNYCFLDEAFDEVNSAALERSLRLNDDGNIELYSDYGSDQFGAPARVFNARSGLPTACADGIEPSSDDSVYQDSSLYVFDVFREILTEYFVDIEAVAAPWQSLADELRYQLPEGPSDEHLFNAMATLLEQLADTHNYVDLGNGQTLRTFTKPTLVDRLIIEYARLIGLELPVNSAQLSSQQVQDFNQYIRSELDLIQDIILDYADQPDAIRQSENELITWFQNQGIGYLNIAAMTGYGDESGADDLAVTTSAIANLDAIMDQALAELADVEALIVDVRRNGGGNDYISLALASRFTSERVHAYSKQARQGSGRTPLIDVVIEPRGQQRYTGPVYLLISPDTVSAAETFALSMSALDNVTLVGEASQGVFSDVLDWTLPNGLAMGMSNEFYLTPGGQWLERTGVPADINVASFNPDDRAQYRDAAIEAALELIGAN